MSYRQLMKEEMEKMSSNRTLFEKKLRKVYAQALEEAKRTGYSIESMTYELLEGMEEGLPLSSSEKESSLLHASKIMLDLLQHSAAEDIDRSERRLQVAQEALHESMESEKRHIQQTLETFKEYSHAHGHQKWEAALKEIEVALLKEPHKNAG